MKKDFWSRFTVMFIVVYLSNWAGRIGLAAPLVMGIIDVFNGHLLTALVLFACPPVMVAGLTLYEGDLQ